MGEKSGSLRITHTHASVARPPKTAKKYLCAGSIATGRINESRTIHGQGRKIADVGIERDDVLVAANTSHGSLAKHVAVGLCAGTVGTVQRDGVGGRGVHSAHGVHLRRAPVVQLWLEKPGKTIYGSTHHFFLFSAPLPFANQIRGHRLSKCDSEDVRRCLQHT